MLRTGLEAAELEVKAELLPVPVEIDDGDHKADALGNDRGQGRAGGGHVKSRHENQIQHQIHNRGYGDKNGGQLAFAHAPEDGADRVVAEDEEHAAAADDGVGGGVGKGLRRGVHEPEKQGTAHDAQKADDHGADQLQGEKGADGGLEVLVFRAHLLAQKHLGAHAEAHAEGQHDEHDLTADAHGGKAAGAHELTHHHHVHHGVDRLEGVGQGHGTGEGSQLL